MAIERPTKGGNIALDDENLARIGLATVLEAQAKSATVSVLRAVCVLSEQDWIRLEKCQFGQILTRLSERLQSLNDQEVTSRFSDLSDALNTGHESRHMVVHAVWGTGGENFIGVDYRRGREMDAVDIQKAVDDCAEIKRAAHWLAMRVAELIIDGTLPERSEGRGLSINVNGRLVRL